MEGRLTVDQGKDAGGERHAKLAQLTCRAFPPRCSVTLQRHCLTGLSALAGHAVACDSWLATIKSHLCRLMLVLGS